jgi:GNAT superfamily N-acetyltransferase
MRIAELITCQEDLFLVNPKAAWPFDHQQWAEWLDPGQGNVSFFLMNEGETIGHAALLKRNLPDTFTVAFLFIRPELRSNGVGRWMVGELEKYAWERLGAQRLLLRVRDYNPRAVACYQHCGFREISHEGTLITMEKC